MAATHNGSVESLRLFYLFKGVARALTPGAFLSTYVAHEDVTSCGSVGYYRKVACVEFDLKETVKESR
eukprot:2308858-Amphidinium_carterae.2